jgi:long-subunit fatty acid transport protein
MKNILLLSLIGFAPCAFAQKSFFGVNGGNNVANQRIVSAINFSSGSTLNGVSFGFNTFKPTFGVFYQIGFSDALAIRINAQYMGLGYDHKSSQGVDVTINYLTFPITLHYAITKTLSFNTGPYLSFTLGGTELNGQSITNTYHKNDFGFSLGAEQTIFKNFAVGVNYFIGAKNIILQDETKDNFGDTVSYKYTNRALQFTMIYKFKKPI